MGVLFSTQYTNNTRSLENILEKTSAVIEPGTDGHLRDKLGSQCPSAGGTRRLLLTRLGASFISFSQFGCSQPTALGQNSSIQWMCVSVCVCESHTIPSPSFTSTEQKEMKRKTAENVTREVGKKFCMKSGRRKDIYRKDGSC